MKTKKFIILAIVAAALSACGSSSNKDDPSLLAQNAGSAGFTGSSGIPWATQPPYATPPPGGSSGGTNPPQSYSFNITGSGGTNPTYTSPAITTDSILRVTLTAGPASNLSLSGGGYSNFTASYGCVSYTVTAVGKTVVSNGLSVSSGQFSFCGGSANTQVIDFSDRLAPGHGAVNVKVSAPKYDFYCQLWYYGWIYGSYSNFCPLYNVYKNHTVTGTLDIETNGN